MHLWLLWRWKGCSMMGRECLVLQLVRSRVGIGMLWGTQGEGLRQGKGPKRSGLGAAGLKRDGPVAGGNQLACSWKDAAGGFVEERGRLVKSSGLGLRRNIKNRAISDTWSILEHAAHVSGQV